MVRLLGAALVNMVVSFAASAEPVTFKCETIDGVEIVDLNIDLANKNMMWGITKYRIIGKTETYITALNESTDHIGGEIWVLNRASGEYWRAAVGKFCINKDCDSSKMGLVSFRGRCSRKQI